jgi:hypothetical protein
MPLARTAPGPASPFDRIWYIKASSLMVLCGFYLPQPLTTISNSNMASIYREVTLCQPCALSAGMNTGARGLYNFGVFDAVPSVEPPTGC